MKGRNSHECHGKSMFTGLSKPLDHNEPFELESDNETAEVEIDLQLSMQEKFDSAIGKEKNSKGSIVKKELVICPSPYW
jgi:hypothetical protein